MRLLSPMLSLPETLMSKKLPKTLSPESIVVKDSKIHGRGVFTLKAIKKGDCILEYQGQRISWKEALRRHPHDPMQPNHTFYFSTDNGRVIDGNVKGNAARWINHSCKPNCEAQEIKDAKNKAHVFIFALKTMAANEELFYNYGLELEANHTAQDMLDYECLCGAKKCRGTMLAKK